MTISMRTAFVLPLFLAFFVPTLHAADAVPTRYFDGAAHEIAASLQAGNGWCAVTARQQVVMVPGAPGADCIRYRVVKEYKSGMTTNGQFFVELTFGPETPWILVELGTPTQSGPSLTAAKAGNAAIGKLDEMLAALEPAISNDPNEAVRALGLQIVAIMRSQRAALVDLIQKDLGTTEMAQ